jgi:glycosyltransferase involved in cell wall biosynthesis
VGRFVQQKDPVTMVEAARRLTSAGVKVVMAGNGELLPEIRRRIFELGLKDSVITPGWVNRDTVLAAADLFVSTAVWEGLPLAALEAAAAGLPLVMSDSPGNRDLAAWGVPVQLFERRAAAALAERIEKLLSDPTARSRLGEESRLRVVGRFSAEKLATDVEEVYRDVARGSFGTMS